LFDELSGPANSEDNAGGKGMVRSCVLVIDSEPVSRQVLCSCFDSGGFRVFEADKPAHAGVWLSTEAPNLALIDIDADRDECFSLARHLNNRHDAGVVVIASEADRGVRIGALDEFADDFVVKPFDMRELLARSRAVLRRTCRARGAPHAAINGNAQGAFKVAGFTLDVGSHRVTVPSGKQVELTATEFRMLKAFLSNPNRVLSRERLLDLCDTNVNGNGGISAFDRAVGMRIGRLREKLGQKGSDAPEFIRTVRGVGYSFAVPADAGRA
jgi:two-component system phosphate regulon response regulator OmpR